MLRSALAQRHRQSVFDFPPVGSGEAGLELQQS